MFMERLKLCMIVYDFTNDEDSDAKEDKQDALEDLRDYIVSAGVFTEHSYGLAITMVRPDFEFLRNI